MAGWWSVEIFKAECVLVGIFFGSVGMGGDEWGSVGNFFARW